MGRGFLILAGTDLVNKASRFAATLLFARLLSLNDFGELNIAIAVAGIIVILASLGLPDLGARQVAVTESRAGLQALIVATLTLRLLATLIFSVGALVLLVGTDYLPPDMAAGAVAMAAAMALSPDWVARGLERMGALGLAWVCGGVTVVLGAAGLVLVRAGPLEALLVFTAGEIVLAIVCWFQIRNHASPVARPSARGGKALVRESWPLAVAAVVTYSYYANVDTLLLGALASPAEAGLYSAPYRVFLVLNTAAMFGAYAIGPAVARLEDADERAGAQRIVEEAVNGLLGYACLVVFGVAMFGGAAMRFLFGSEFAAATPVFLILTAAVPWHLIGFPTGYSLISAGRHREFMYGAASAALTNVVANLLLIPRLGAEGAALATVVGFAVGAGVWLSRRPLSRLLFLKAALAVGLSSATLAAALSDSSWRYLLAALLLFVGVECLARAWRNGASTILNRP